MKLSPSVKSVSLQFTFSRSALLPTLLRLRERPTAPPKPGFQRPQGTTIVPQTENVSVLPLIDELLQAGYELVDAFSQRRDEGNGTKTTFRARWVFARKEDVPAIAGIADIAALRPQLLAALRKVAEEAMWRVEAFENGHYVKNVPVAGESAVSIELKSRRPFREPNGNPVVMWTKPENEREPGDKALPIAPVGALRVVENTLQLASA